MEQDPMYLVRRAAVYYYRRPILKEHQGIWVGPTGKPSREWSTSLRTTDRRTAIDRMPAAERQYQAELARRLKNHLAGLIGPGAGLPSKQPNLAQDDLSYVLASERFDVDEARQAEWGAEHDPIWPQRENLREQAARARDAEANLELLKELRREEQVKRAVPFMALFEDWSAKYGKPDTVAAYKSYAEDFAKHVGKADANQITEDDVSDWRNRLQSKGGLSGKQLSAKTINGAYMCAISAIFEHAKSETRRVRANPAAGLRALRVKKQPQFREQSITDSEALLLLVDAMKPGSDRLSPERAAAKRWCQWLMAYTGARVSEVAQLRKEDVGELNGIPYVYITPDAGKVKTEEARKVPLHPHLIEQGFLVFVAKQSEGPLFYDPKKGRGGRLGSQVKKVGQYLCNRVRDLKVTVAQPNHGWRHRMETMNNRYDLRDKNLQMILGHRGKDSNSRYGDHELPAMLREIKKLPAYQGLGLPSFTPEQQ